MAPAPRRTLGIGTAARSSVKVRAVSRDDPWHSPPPDPERARVLELLRRHGHGPTSFQILERGFSYWFGEEAAVGYVDAGGWRVAAGCPVCAPERVGDVAARFVAAAGRPVAFFGVEPDFLSALERAGVVHDALQVAEQPDWDPRGYTTEGRDRRSLRAQVNRAEHKDVRVRRISPDDLARAPGSLRAEIEQVLDAWLDSRRMSVMRFMVDLEPFSFPEERRYYVAERGDQPVGFLAAIPVFGRSGWFFEDVIRVPDAPNGTAELLIHTAMTEAKERGEPYVTFGMAPLAGVEPGPGRHRWMRAVLHLCFDRLGALYPFAGVRSFKARFRPDRWTPQYLVACPGPVRVRTFQALLGAFAAGGLLRFGAATLWRLLGRVRPATWAWFVRATGLALVPWTVLLALADGRYWFGDPSIKWAWVTFDALMVGALLWLAEQISRGRRAARTLAVFFAGATLTDLVLSTVQALHLHRAVTAWEPRIFVAAGLAGPLVCTALLVTIAVVLPTPRRIT